MEKHIKDKFNDEILTLAMRVYNILPKEIKLLDGFESFIYEYQSDGGEYILRIGHSSRRTIEMIEGEVDWINYLSANGVNTAAAMLSSNKKLVEPIDDGHGGAFLATAFVKAQGKHPNTQTWQAPLWEHYGEQIGRMHALSKHYAPPKSAWKRPAWNAPANLEVVQWIPAKQKVVIDKFTSLMQHLEALPQTEDDYGLIHQDVHSENFFVDDAGQITIFDFDDCCYGWYAYDLAMVIFYASMWEKDPQIFSETFLTSFMKGYRRENSISFTWLNEIPNFLKLREIDLYALIHRSMDVDNLTNDWDINYMNGRRKKIENTVPYLDIDFTNF